MLKLMRACMGVKDAKDLWFNRNEEKVENIEN